MEHVCRHLVDVSQLLALKATCKAVRRAVHRCLWFAVLNFVPSGSIAFQKYVDAKKRCAERFRSTGLRYDYQFHWEQAGRWRRKMRESCSMVVVRDCHDDVDAALDAVAPELQLMLSIDVTSHDLLRAALESASRRLDRIVWIFVHHRATMQDSDLELLRDFGGELIMRYQADVTDAGVARLRRVRLLDISACQRVYGAGMLYLAAMCDLAELRYFGYGVNSVRPACQAALQHVKDLGMLSFLWASNYDLRHVRHSGRFAEAVARSTCGFL